MLFVANMIIQLRLDPSDMPFHPLYRYSLWMLLSLSMLYVIYMKLVPRPNIVAIRAPELMLFASPRHLLSTISSPSLWPTWAAKEACLFSCMGGPLEIISSLSIFSSASWTHLILSPFSSSNEAFFVRKYVDCYTAASPTDIL